MNTKNNNPEDILNSWDDISGNKAKADKNFEEEILKNIHQTPRGIQNYLSWAAVIVLTIINLTIWFGDSGNDSNDNNPLIMETSSLVTFDTEIILSDE